MISAKLIFSPSSLITSSSKPTRRIVNLRAMAGSGQQHKCIYLDYNATTPIFPEVAEAMKPYFNEFGNPSSTHPYGRKCKEAIEHARQQVARLVNSDPSEIYFCSSGTEADNWAIWGAVAAYRLEHPGVTPHVISSTIEHPAVLEQLKQLKGLGLITYSLAGVDGYGVVATDQVLGHQTPNTCLIALMHSNNEVGTVQADGLEDIACNKRPGLLLHSDAAQSIGKVPVDVKQLGVDMLTIVGHKFGAPKGVAALYIKSGVSKSKVANFFNGGGQERGRRGGTENVLLIVGLGKAAEIAFNELERTKTHMAYLRNELQCLLVEGMPEKSVRVNGPVKSPPNTLSISWLPNTLSISFKGISGSQLLSELSEEVAASAGAACHSSEGEPVISSVLAAMDVPREWAVGTVRLTVGRHTTESEVKRAAELILNKVKEMQAKNNA
jgi:cysteine desulfurase